MKKGVLIFVAGVITPFIVAWLFILSGGMPVATKSPPLPLEKYLAKTALHAVLRGEMNKTAPLTADENTLREGARVYTQNCAGCHGFTNEGESGVAKGMFPPPPQLLPPKGGVTDDPVGETYWKVKNGIRLTGMPGFSDSLTETQMWQVSLFLVHVNQLPPGVLESIKP